MMPRAVRRRLWGKLAVLLLALLTLAVAGALSPALALCA